MQEAATGKKRVEKLDWMYAAPSNNEGAMGGRLSEQELEAYLLGKKRVDEVLAASDKNVSGTTRSTLCELPLTMPQVGNTHTDFIAVQNANSARDTASKIREDPLLAMKKAEQAQLAALMNRPDIRRQMREKNGGGKEDKEERRAKRRAEKEERKRERRRRDDYSDDDRRERRDRSRDRHDRHRDERDRDSRRNRSPRRDRSVSPRRDRDSRGDDRRDGPSRRDVSPRGNGHRDSRPRSDEDERRERDPYGDLSRNGSSSRSTDSRDHRDSRERSYRNGDDYARRDNRDNGRNPDARDRDYGRDQRQPERRPEVSRAAPPPPRPAGNALDDARAARLAAMQSNAQSMTGERSQILARRAEEEKKILESEERARSKYHRDEATGLFMKHQEQMSGKVSLAETLQRRGGQGLLRDL